jgi:GNAT superfamily N-acetyltransferase
VGFAHVKVLEPRAAHLEEIDVHPEHGRRGLGTQLVMAVCEWAATEGYRSVTLTLVEAWIPLVVWRCDAHATRNDPAREVDRTGRANKMTICTEEPLVSGIHIPSRHRP